MTDHPASAPAPSPQEVDEKWAAYPNTILEFDGPPRLRIDLRAPIGDGERARLGRLGLDGPFGVFTAENPAGENAEDEPTGSAEQERKRANDRRAGRLERELQRLGVAYAHVDGVSPDGVYREHCVATLMAREEAIALARRYEQLALFWFDGDAFWLLPALASKSPERLPAPRTAGNEA